MISLLVASVLGLTEADRAAAVADYSIQLQQNNECRYVELLGTTERELEVVQVVCNLTSMQPSIEAGTPGAVPGTRLLRVSLDALGWRREDWSRIYGTESPYSLGKHDPLIVPSHDFLQRILDGRKSNAYLAFLFSGKPPKDAQGFLRAFGIDQDKQGGLQINHVENSEVNVNDSPSDAPRLIRADDGIQSYSFSTYDVEAVKAGSDPLESFDGFKYDGQETFILFPKISSSTGVRAAVSAVFLADKNEKLVANAPTALVEDHGKTFGIADIVSPGSCWSCHQGAKPLGLNALRQRLEAGVQLSTYDAKKQYEIDATYLASMDDQLRQWDRDWERALWEICGMVPEDFSKALQASIKDYLQPVTLERGALELGCSQDDLRAALGYASSQDFKMSARLAGMPQGIASPRSAWEDDFDDAYGFLKLWRSRK